jgi:RimJ/RimL family protein N-acetyltransferase
MDQILLKTGRMILRRFTEADIEDLYELDNDPDVMRYINGGTPVSRKAIQNEILPTFLHYDARQPAFGFWAAVEKISGYFLGWFSIRPANNIADTAALGYRLRRAAWSKGYATEGVRALIDKAFAELGFQRVVATTYEKNLASRRVMEKAGMTLVRRFRLTREDLQQADTYHAASLEVWDGDDLEYAIEKSDWMRQQSPGP